MWRVERAQYLTKLSHRAEDFIRRYMWPNSCLPSATALITAAQTGSEGRFQLEGVENHAARKFRYCRTFNYPSITSQTIHEP